MKILLALVLVLASYGVAGAQMTCKPANLTTQTCSVTVSWEDPVNPKGTTYTVQRRDGSGMFTDIGTVATLSLVNVFNDAGNVAHDYRAFALNSGLKSGPSNTATWTTPAIVPPAPAYPSVPPLASISVPVAPVVWSLGQPALPAGNFEILRNGVSAGGARGSKIALCNNQIFVLGRDKLWWRFTGAWVQTGSAKLPCD